MNPLFRMDYIIFWGLVAVIVGMWLSWRSAHRCPRHLRAVAVLSRGIGIAALFAIALNVGRWVAPPSETVARCAVLLDTSTSMAVADVNERTRLDAARHRLGTALATLETPETVALFGFSDRLTAIGADALNTLEPRAGATDIMGAGHSLLNRMHGPDGHITGILLLSDGRQVVRSGRRDLALRARAANIPIVTVCLGSQVVPRDLEVTTRRPLIVSFGNQRVHVPVKLANRGMGDIRITVQLLDQNQAVAASMPVELPNNATRDTVLTVPPRPGGYAEYSVTIPVWEHESRAINNRDRVGIMTLDSRLRVLLIEGTPHWDSKFLTQLLRRQTGIEVTAIYRLAADRFFRVEASTEQARQVSESTFPDSLAALEAYDAVVFGKGVEYFLTPARVQLLNRYLTDRGGCVLFARGKPYVGTFDALESIEPVTWGAAVADPVHLRPTTVGVHAGLFGAMLPGLDDPLWSTLPAMSGACRIRHVHGFAQVLAACTGEAMPEGRTIPALIARRVGAGLVLTMNGDGLWEWDFAPASESVAAFYKEFWIQLLYWVATYRDFLPGQAFALKMEPATVNVGEPVHAVAAARGTTVTNPPAVVISRDSAPVTTLPLAAQSDEARWDGYFTPDEPGTYAAELVDAATGTPLGPRAAFEVRPPPAESDKLSADPAFLSVLAADSGGRTYTLDQLDEALQQVLPAARQTAVQGQAIWRPAWDHWWWLVLALGVFALEWTIRRRSGML